MCHLALDWSFLLISKMNISVTSPVAGGGGVREWSRYAQANSSPFCTFLEHGRQMSALGMGNQPREKPAGISCSLMPPVGPLASERDVR